MERLFLKKLKCKGRGRRSDLSNGLFPSGANERPIEIHHTSYIRNWKAMEMLPGSSLVDDRHGALSAFAYYTAKQQPVLF